MLFNSYQFIFLFLPAMLAAFFLLGRLYGRPAAFGALILGSTLFYGAWAPINIAIMAPSVFANYGCAHWLGKLRARESRWASLLLILAIAGNVAFLGYFKYRNFFLDSANQLFATDFPLGRLVLPLGISFITFQKIGFLVDVYSDRVKEFTLLKYLLFVVFFPQLIAGPIVHYREMIPQFERATFKPNATDFAVAISLFSIGLFKKVVIADGVALHATPIFDAAAMGAPQSFFWAWGAAFAYAFQIYFDFSGYSDMALGLARFFGIRLPLNFNSPFKASSIIELWSRWHVTLTRFLTAYIYTPLVMSLTRRRMVKRKPILAGARTGASAFLALVAVPTMVTMGISGLWHGAGTQFIVWGLLHGMYLTINHAWRLIRPKLWRDTLSYERLMKPLGLAITFLCFVVALVFFRANSVLTALAMLKGMVGLNGIILPEALGGPLGSWIDALGITIDFSSGSNFLLTYVWIIVLFVYCVVLPNSLDLFSGYEPALGFPAPQAAKGGLAPRPAGASAGTLSWQPNWRWAMQIAAISTVALMSVTRVSEFLYWQF
jgi:alginate O-acetyltransferase complex protein AlgI